MKTIFSGIFVCMAMLTQEAGAENDEIQIAAQIVADTNRDASISEDDVSGKDEWTTQRGAIYAVNFDSDGNLMANKKRVADAITWWDNEGTPLHEDWKINGQSDKDDITPINITVPTLPDGSKAYLVAGETEDIHAIHLFPRIKEEQEAIWGAFLDTGKPWTDDANPLDIEITQWLNASADSPPGSPGYNESGVKEGTYTFGIEGLLFRGMTVTGGSLEDNEGKFSGIVDFELELKIPDKTERQKCGKVRLKVAPFLLTPNDRTTDKVFVMDTPGGLQSISPAAVINSGLLPSQWLQDHAEIGYTQRPGGQVIKISLGCAYEGNILAEWIPNQLLSANKGIFALGKNFSSGGDYGGNIELSNSQENYPLGRILAGNTISEKFRVFLEAQEKQSPIVSDISYTEVKHIDEVLSPGPSNTTYVTDPAGAVALLKTAFTEVQQKLEGVLFAEDEEKAINTTVFATVFSPQNHFVITNLDYDTHHATWDAYANGYLRIVTVGLSGGQVARISAVSEAVAGDHPSVNVAGKLKLEVSKVWNTAQTNAASNRRASQKWNQQSGAPQVDWHNVPAQGAFVVAVKMSKHWSQDCPAVITVGEILADDDFLAFNETTMPQLIQATVTTAGINNPGKIPCLFYKAQISSGQTYGVAYSPNTANLQWVNSNPANANPFGPRDSSNNDVLRQGIMDSLIGNSTFIDDWSSYHTRSGEIHCGSNAERQAEENWWSK